MIEPTEPPEDRFCDLVMKGGLTSGIVYPKAIALLAERYRFRSIGGSSAGAIAAAITAAAEFRRRHTNTRMGFDILSRLPEELHAKMPGTNRSKLLSLFQAQPKTKRLMFTLVFSLNRRGTYRRLASIVAGLLMAYWPATIMSILAAAAAWQFGAGVIAAVLVLPVALAVTIGIWTYRDITRGMVENGFGMCTGLALEAGGFALTPWLHELIQQVAGLQPGDPPLTFGQLWNAPGFPPQWMTLPKSVKPRSIDLQMFATNLGHGRPYIFPPATGDESPSRFRTRERLFFRPQELAQYLPSDVLEWMKSHGRLYTIEAGREKFEPPEAEANQFGLLELPKPEDIPVILATRMSLSFPLLLSALPLWAINYDAPPGKRHFKRCWFSDGGISSNFPMHLFDQLVPLWPTFGINLEPTIANRGEVFLPADYAEGYGERWNNFDAGSTSASRFGGFVAAIVQTMQNWNDNSLSRMPGVRDRIVRVRLEANEGGMNLNMERDLIEKISARGELAARAILARFDSASAAYAAVGWDEQRFVRLCVLLKMIEARGPGVANAIDPACPYATDLYELIDRATREPDKGGRHTAPPGYEKSLTPQQADALRQALEKLKANVTNPSGTCIDFKPVPVPELRVRPPL